MDVFQKIHGEEEYIPVVNAYRQKLRSSTSANSQSNPSATRTTPRFLRVIATPDDEPRRRLEAEPKGDVAILRWKNVQQYLSDAADAATANFQSIL